MILLYWGLLLLVTSFLFKKNYSVYWGFLFVLVIMGFQTAQTDYISYNNSFYVIKNLSKFGLADNPLLYSSYKDVGWNYLNILFSFSTFPFMVFCIALSQYYILCRVIKEFVDPMCQYLAPIFFYFTFSFMLMQMTAMRQGFAIELCLAALLCLRNNKVLASSILCCVAYSIHGTAVLGIFVVLLYAINKWRNLFSKSIHKNDFYYPIIITGLYLLLYIVKDVFMGSLTSVALSLYSGEYDHYLSQIDFVEISSLYVLYNGIMAFLSVFYYKYATADIRVFIVVSVIANFAEMLFFGLSDLPRVFLYFSICSIVVLPNIASFLKQRLGNIPYYAFIVLCIGYAIKSFLPHIVNGGYFSTYEFVFN